MLPLLLVGGAVVALVAKGVYDDKKRRKKEIALWNNGKCAKCGSKWRIHYYYPKGSSGAYQYAEITCHRCKRKATLQVYLPSDITKYENIDIDKQNS